MAIVKEERGCIEKTTVHVCEDCRSFAPLGRAIVHGRRCGTPLAQPAIDPATITTPSERRAAAAARDVIHRAAKAGAVSAVLSDSEIVDAVSCGAITMSDAMNRDF